MVGMVSTMRAEGACFVARGCVIRICVSGVNNEGCLVWVKTYGHLTGIITTALASEAQFFVEPQEITDVISEIDRTERLYDVGLQFVAMA